MAAVHDRASRLITAVSEQDTERVEFMGRTIHFYFTLGRGVRSAAMSMSVRLSARISRKPHKRTPPIFFAHVACSRGSVLLRRRCDKLRTSGFVDDVIFSHDELSVVRCVYSEWREHNRRNCCIDSDRILFNDKD